jgi:hypothetical protein
MNQFVGFTVAASLVGILMKWERQNHLRPPSIAFKRKSAATRVDRSIRSVEAALEILMATIANEKARELPLAQNAL